MNKRLFFKQLTFFAVSLFLLIPQLHSQHNCGCHPTIGINFDDCTEKNQASEVGIYVFSKDISQYSKTYWIRIFANNQLLSQQEITLDDKGFWSEVLAYTPDEDTKIFVEFHCDKNKCFTEASKIIHTLPHYSLDKRDITCHGEKDGSIKLNSQESLSLIWGSGEKINEKTDLSAGSYALVVQAANGCSRDHSVSIYEPSPLSVMANQYMINTATYAKIDIQGGTSPYTCQWNGDVQKIDTHIISYNKNQNCTVEITDSKGCKMEKTIDLDIKKSKIVEPKDGELVAEKVLEDGQYVYNLKKSLDPVFGDIDGDELVGALLTVDFYLDQEMQLNIDESQLENFKNEGNTILFANFTMGQQSISTNTLILTPNARQFCLQESEACDNGSPVELIPVTCMEASVGLPLTGVYQIFRLNEDNTKTLDSSRLIGPDGDGKFFFNPTNGSGNYIVEYDLDGEIYEALFDVQELNPQFRPQNLPICDNDEIFELRANPRGGTISGPIDAARFYDVGTNRIFVLDPSLLDVNTPYNFTYHYSQNNLSGLVCSKNAQTTITVLTAPTVSLDNSETQLCEKEEITLTQVSSITDGSQDLSFRWFFQRPGVPDSLLSEASTLSLPEIYLSGRYLVEVIQDNQCRERAFQDIDVVSLPQVNVQVLTDPNCFGVSSARVNVSVDGVSEYDGYTFDWLGKNTNETRNGRFQENLPADTFSITVTSPPLNMSGLMCSITDSIIIQSHPPLYIVCSPRDTSMNCFGDSDMDRKIKYNPEATEPVMFSLDNINGPFTSNKQLSNLGVGNDPNVLSREFKIFLRDGNGCVDSCEFTLRQPPPLSSSTSSTSLSCFNSGDGTATVTATGGTAPYQFNWSNGFEDGPSIDGQSTLTSVSAGSYTVTVTDTYGCSTTNNVIVQQPALIQSNIPPIDVCLDFDTFVTANPEGGTGSYSFAWSLLDSGTTLAVDSHLIGSLNESSLNFSTWCLQPGVATVGLIVTDENNCSVSASATVTLASCFDLALKKQVADPQKQYYPGDSVTFTIELFNQGTVDAQDIVVMDVLDDNMEFFDSDNTLAITGNTHLWTINPEGHYTLFVDNLSQLSKTEVKIVLRIKDNTTSNFMTNWAEISGSKSIVNGRIKDNPIDEDDCTPTPEYPDCIEVDDEICDTHNGVFEGECTLADNPTDEDKKDFAIVSICQLRGPNVTQNECITPGTRSNGIDLASIRQQLQPSNDPDVTLVSVHNNYLDAMMGQNPITGRIRFIPGNGGQNSNNGRIDGQGNLMVFTNQEVNLFGRLLNVEGCIAVSAATLDFVFTPELVRNLNASVVAVENQEDVCLSVEVDNSFQVPLMFQWQQNINGTFSNIFGANKSEFCLERITIDLDRSQFRVLVFDTNDNNQGCALVSSAASISIDDDFVLVCNDWVNISVDGACEVWITPDMILEDPRGLHRIEIKIQNQNGVFVPNPLTSEHIGQTFTIHAVDTFTGNSCWSQIIVEDKLPPVIECPLDYTVSCANTAFFPPTPAFEDACDPDATLTLVSNVWEELSCDHPSGYIALRRLSYVAQDKYGNISAPCTFYVYYQPVNINNTIWPSNKELSCVNSQSWDLNRDNYPNAVETGFPSIGGFNLARTATGSINFVESNNYCKVSVTLTDVSIPLCGNTYKVARDWTVLDWCTGAIVKHTQLIAIVDKSAPVVNCQSNEVYQLWANHQECSADFSVPAPTSITDCNTTTWNVAYLVSDSPGQAPMDGQYITDNVVLEKGTYTITQLPFGRTWIRYTIVDACDNVTYCFTAVEVIDVVKPTPICDETTVISLDAQGQARMFANSIDDGSFDNCSDVTFALRRLNNNCPLSPEATAVASYQGQTFYDFVDFCCPDQTLNQQQVELLVIDASNNKNTCTVNVVVQQKILPLLTLPEDRTVDCEDGTSPTALHAFATFVAPCAIYYLDYLDFVSEGECGDKTISRTWQVKAIANQNVVVSGVQTIRVRNLTPFNLNSIVFPENKTLINQCQNAQDFGPHNPVSGGFPTWESLGCSQVAVSYVDQVFDEVDDACFKIIRHWSAIDGCTYDPNNPSTLKTHQQVIKVLDTEKPTAICVPVNEEVIEGCSKRVSFMGAGTDSCTPSEELTYSYVLNGGSQVNSRWFNQVLNVGIHTVVWTVTDKCDNSNTCTQIVNVRDIKKPTPYCITEIATVLMPSSNSVDLWAKDYNVGAQDNCSGVLRFTFGPHPPVSFNRKHFYKAQGNRSIEASEAEYLNGEAELWDPLENSSAMLFDCDDIGIQQLSLYVWDNAGNNDFCSVRIKIQDNADNCGRSRPAFVSGTVVRDNTPLTDLQIIIENEFSTETQVILTDANGIYQYDKFSNGVHYNLRPHREGDWLNGVSTLDLVLIQRHILGMQPFEAPLQLLAADANNDARVTASDIVEIRKLILGVEERFTKNDSWKFVFDNKQPITQPWSLPVVVDFIAEPSAEFYFDFKSVKIGDVNNSALVKAQDNLPQARNSHSHLWVEDIFLKAGQEVKVPVRLEGNPTFYGLQYALKLKEGATLKGIHSGALNVSPQNYHIAHSNEAQRLTFSYHNEKRVALDDNTVLFEWVIVPDFDGMLSEFISIDHNFSSEIVTDLEQSQPIQIRIKDSDEKEIESGHLMKVFQNVPNPFSHLTQIDFYMPNSEVVDIRITDLTGQTLQQYDFEAYKGRNTLQLSRNDLGQRTGVFIVTFTTSTHSESLKIICTE